MFARPMGMNKPGFGFGGAMQPQQTPNFGATPGMNPMANQPQGMMGRIAGMGQMPGSPMGQPQNMQRPQMDEDRKRQMLAMILSNGGMANGLR